MGQGKVLCFDNVRWEERGAADWLATFGSQSLIGLGALTDCEQAVSGLPPTPPPPSPPPPCAPRPLHSVLPLR